MTDAIVLVPLFPLLAVLANLLFGRKMSEKAVGIMGSGAVGASFLAAVTAVAGLIGMEPGHRLAEVVLYQWISSGAFTVDIGFLLDPLSAVMILVVSGVGFLIHVYSIGYMHHDKGFSRYFLRHAPARYGQQLPSSVHRMGGCGSLFLSTYRVLVPQGQCF
jgi:NADH-quinone oxidoreductase subunit L